MFDIEIVVLDIGEHSAGEADLLLENRARLVGHQLRIFLRDAIALGGDRRGRTLDLFAALGARRVVAQIAERDLGMLAPIFVRGIEAVARSEVEPRILRLLPRLQPCRAVAADRDGGERLVEGTLGQRVVDAEVDGQPREFLQFVVGAEQIGIDALYHARDRLIRHIGELLLHEGEEVEIGGVTEVQELEMILPRAIVELDRAVVVLQKLRRIVEAAPLDDPFARNYVGQRRERERLHLLRRGADLFVPVFEQRRPVLEIVTSAVEE